MATTLALVACILAGYLLWKRFTGKEKTSWASGSTALPREIALILDQAMLHRSRFDTSFHPATTSRQAISCALADHSDKGVVLEVPVGVTPSPSWVGREMACYFRIPRENKQPFFYKFISAVSKVFTQDGMHYLVLDIPKTIDLGQKRKHLRLEIPTTDIKDFRLWSATEDSSSHFETDQTKWPKPLAVLSQEQRNSLRVLDISGGGIKLAIDPKHNTSLNDFITQYPFLFMRLELEPAGDMHFPPHVLAAKLRTKTKDYDTGALLLGYEFVECSSTDVAEELEWIKIEPDRGIDDLVTWVFKRHLELYREREIV